MKRLLPLTVTSWLLVSLAPAAPPGKFEFVDLQPYANQKLKDPLGGGQPRSVLAALVKDGRTLAGVNFKIGQSAIQLGSKLLAVRRPDKVEGIKVGKACAKIHILHATEYGNGSTVGQEAKEGDPLF